MPDEWEKHDPFDVMLKNKLPVVEQANSFVEAVQRTSGIVGEKIVSTPIIDFEFSLIPEQPFEHLQGFLSFRREIS